jgi:putative redox protein
MADDNKDVLNELLSGYKQNINPAVKTVLVWERDLVFTGSTPQGYEIEFDANAQWGCQPMESLLLSLAGCMGIDIMTILKKMRLKIASFRIEMNGERNPQPPQYYKTVEMVMHLAGKNLEPGKMERAIALSRDKYCSVYNSLRPDMKLNIRFVLEDRDLPGDERS